RDLTVDVLAREVVLMPGERIREGMVLEAAREGEPARVATVDGKVGEHFIHAAMLGIEHLCNLRSIEGREDACCPLGEANLDLQCLATPDVPIGVAEAGEGLVQGVPGRPEPVEIEC